MTCASVLMRSPPKVKVMPQVTASASKGGVSMVFAQFDLFTVSPVVVTCLNEPSLHGEHPDRTPLRHIRILAGEDQVHARLHFRGVGAPAVLPRDILLAVDLERYWHRGNARAGRKLPQHLPGPGVERAEHAVVGAAREQQSAARGEA